MSLTKEWFDNRLKRQVEWDETGLSLSEANNLLQSIRSTASPMGQEVANYIKSNWTANRVFLLTPASIEILMSFWISQKEIKEKMRQKAEELNIK